MATVAHFLRCVIVSNLLRHLQKLGVETVDAPEVGPHSVAWLHSHLTNAQYDQLVIDANRVMAMSDEVGQAAMLAMPAFRQDFDAIEGAHHRAHWLFLRSSSDFRRAEEIRYADEHQNAQRQWDGFEGPIGCAVRNGEDDLAAFAGKLKLILSKDRLHIENFERSRQRADEEESEIVQVTIYSEGLPEDEIVFANEELVNQTRKPVRETAIVYEADTGTIEVVGRERKTRAEIARAFAEILLGHKIKAARMPARNVDLFPLLDSHSFPTAPNDGIARVKLTRLVCSTNDDTLVQSFQVPFKHEASLYDVVRDQYGEDNPLDGDLNPWSAEIQVEFEPDAAAGRGKKIKFTLTVPNKCSLRGKTARERQILSRHLRAWGLFANP
jgi:hypothetical protein